jgi:hypothetical protein
MNDGLERMWKAAVVALSKNLHGKTEESHEKSQSVWPVSGPRFEPRTSRILRTGCLPLDHDVRYFRSVSDGGCSHQGQDFPPPHNVQIDCTSDSPTQLRFPVGTAATRKGSPSSVATCGCWKRSKACFHRVSRARNSWKNAPTRFAMSVYPSACNN